MMQNKNESGRSMIEMLGVLSIMGVIMYGAVAGINFGIDMYKINATHSEIEELAQAVSDLYSWSEDYNGLQGSSGAGGSACPVSNKIVCMNDAHRGCRSMDNSNTCFSITNEWGGDVSVVATECKDGSCQNFNIVYAVVPRLACERLHNDTAFRNVCWVGSKCSTGSSMGVNEYCCSNGKTDITFAPMDSAACKGKWMK